MKKFAKKIIAIMMGLVMTLPTAMPVFADELDNPIIPIDDPEPITLNYDFNANINGSYWQTVITDSSFNCNVRITYNYGNIGVNRVGIRMYSGNTLVWSGKDISSTNTTVTYWCGANITSIQLAIVDPVSGNLVGSSASTANVRIQAPV
jgi:hypothetical protein